jgi:hypothetical protein
MAKAQNVNCCRLPRHDRTNWKHRTSGTDGPASSQLSLNVYFPFPPFRCAVPPPISKFCRPEMKVHSRRVSGTLNGASETARQMKKAKSIKRESNTQNEGNG